MKLWDLQHNFQNWVFRVLEAGTAKPSVQNPCFLFKAYFASSWIQTPVQKSLTRIQSKAVKTHFLVSARGLQSPYFGHFESCHRCDVSKTSSSSLPSVRAVSFHPIKSPAAGRGGCCAVFSSCAAAAEARLDLPLSKRAWGREDCCGARGLPGYRRPTALSNTMRAALLPHHHVGSVLWYRDHEDVPALFVEKVSVGKIWSSTKGCFNYDIQLFDSSPHFMCLTFHTGFWTHTAFGFDLSSRSKLVTCSHRMVSLQSRPNASVILWVWFGLQFKKKNLVRLNGP